MRDAPSLSIVQALEDAGVDGARLRSRGHGAGAAADARRRRSATAPMRRPRAPTRSCWSPNGTCCGRSTSSGSPASMAQPVLVDLRNVYPPEEVGGSGPRWHGVGRPRAASRAEPRNRYARRLVAVAMQEDADERRARLAGLRRPRSPRRLRDAPAGAEPAAVPATATAAADIRDASAGRVARATATPGRRRRRVRVEAAGFAPGTYGAHVHAVGRCDRAGLRQRRPALEPDRPPAWQRQSAGPASRRPAQSDGRRRRRGQRSNSPIAGAALRGGAQSAARRRRRGDRDPRRAGRLPHRSERQ